MKPWIVVSAADRVRLARRGRECLKSWVRLIAPEIPLRVWFDDPSSCPDRRLDPQPLDECPGWDGFVRQAMPERNRAPRLPDGRPDPRWDPLGGAIRFFVLHALLERPPARRIVWLDADVMAHRPVTPAVFAAAMPPGAPVAYLWRPQGADLGFLAIDPESPVARRLVEEGRQIWLSGRWRELSEWRAATVFDMVRRRLETGNVRFFDVGRRIGRQTLHPFVNSVLGGFFDHLRGSRAEAGASPTSDLVVARREPWWRNRREIPRDGGDA